MKWRTLVVDDEDLVRRRVRELAAAHPGLEVIGEAADGAEALDRITAQSPDLVLLDIEMPELDGFQLIDELDEDALPAIIFITAYDEHAIRAFDVGALDYLLKPITKERFDAAVDRMLRRAAPAAREVRELAARLARERGQPLRLVARRNGRHYFVPVTDITWLEAEGNYVRIHVRGEQHLVRHTMKQIERELDPTRFLRVHRSRMIAIDRIRGIAAREHGEYVITLDDGSVHASSRTYSPRIRSLLRRDR